MIRHDNNIGRHTVTFERRGNVLTVRVNVDAQVAFLSIPIVRYTHRAVETWNGDTLVSLSGQTDRNGDNQWMNAHRTAKVSLRCKAARSSRMLRQRMRSEALRDWNKHLLEVPMIAAWTTVSPVQHPKVENRGMENIPPRRRGYSSPPTTII